MHTSQLLLDCIHIDDVQKCRSHFLIEMLVIDHFLHVEQAILLIRALLAYVRCQTTVFILDGFAQRLKCSRQCDACTRIIAPCSKLSGKCGKVFFLLCTTPAPPTKRLFSCFALDMECHSSTYQIFAAMNETADMQQNVIGFFASLAEDTNIRWLIGAAVWRQFQHIFESNQRHILAIVNGSLQFGHRFHFVFETGRHGFAGRYLHYN